MLKDECQMSIREDFKYYFADFVRKGGPPPPLYGQNFRQKKGYGFGGYPPPPLYGFFFQRKGGYGFGGYPPPLYGQNPQSSI